MQFSEIQRIRLHDVLPLAFDSQSDRALFGSSQVMLRTVDLSRGSIYCLNASSGTGKTSLCSFMFGARTDYAGSIFFDDTDIRTLSISQWCEVRRRHLAYLPQELDLFDELSAMDNVMLKNRLTDFKSEAEIRTMFERLEIDNRIDRQAGCLSVGQKQRVALIRAVCQPFDFIILDEPVSHLDVHSNRLCSELVLDAAHTQGAGIVFTSVGNPLLVSDDLVSLNL